MKYEQQFLDAIAGAGYVAPTKLIADGELHRFSSNGKPNDDSGWYVLHTDYLPAGSFGCWRDGQTHTWRADIGRDYSPDEQLFMRERMEAQRQKREAEKEVRQKEAKLRARNLWATAMLAGGHEYLTRKGIKTHGVKRHGNELIVPVRQGNEITSLQFISPDGDKRFLSGGKVQGGYYSLGNPKDAPALCVCEGFATGASINEATGLPVAVAFNAGNLVPVAQAMRSLFPDLPIVVCADDDYLTEGNTGIAKAKQAAQSVGGCVAIPQFGVNRPEKATDFNDLALHLGNDAVKACIDAAMSDQNAGGEATPSPNAKKSRDGVQMIQASTVKMESVTWLWDGYLALGKFHLLGGAPATGKTTISMSLAATVSNGGKWADGTQCEQGNVVIWSSEDSPEDTLVPRLALCGADLSKIYFVGDVVEGNGERPFDPATDFAPLAEKLIEIGNVRLLIIDPIVSAIQGDSHKNAEVRRGLQPLVDLAMSLKCSLLGITHFSKGTGGREPTERITGSLAFGALARIVLVTAKHQSADGEEKPKRIFTRAKSNISPDGGGFEYDIENGEVQAEAGVFSSKVTWGVSLEGSARDLLAEADDTDSSDGGAGTEATHFLMDILTHGAVSSKEVKEKAKAEGISKRTLERASKKLGVKSERSTFGGGTVWYLPNPENPSVAPQKTNRATHKSMAQMEKDGANGDVDHIVEVEF